MPVLAKIRLSRRTVTPELEGRDIYKNWEAMVSFLHDGRSAMLQLCSERTGCLAQAPETVHPRAFENSQITRSLGIQDK